MLLKHDLFIMEGKTFKYKGFKGKGKKHLIGSGGILFDNQAWLLTSLCLSRQEYIPTFRLFFCISVEHYSYPALFPFFLTLIQD